MKRITFKIRRVTAFLLAFVFLIPLMFGSTTEAHAAGTVNLFHDTQYHYGNWSTGNLSVDDGAGTAFCVQPSKDTPPNGSYPYELMSQNSDMRKVLYYLVGGNGYDEVTSGTLFSEYNYIDIYVTSHVMLSWMWDGCEWNGDADSGIGSDFKEQIESLYEEIMALPDPPEAFQTFIIEGEEGYQTVVGSWPLQNIEVSIMKRSAIPSFTEDNACYSLEGTVYGIYATKEDAQSSQNEVASFMIREDGTSEQVSLKPGTYYYKETKAGRGYALNPETYEVEIAISDEMTQTIEVAEIPQYNPVDLLLLKKYKEGKEQETTGDARLAGAEFTVKYYPDVTASGKPKYTWIFQTDEKGMIYYQDAYKKSGPDLIRDMEGNPVLPLGTVTIQETMAPDGYLINDTLYTVPITAEGNAENVSTYSYPVVEEDVIRGGVAFEKHDAELGATEAMGGGSLAGITFALCNESPQPVLVDGTLYQKGDLIRQFTTDDSGHIETSPDYLPYGTYSLQETATNDSYLLSDGEKHEFSIRENRVVVSPDRVGNQLVFSNQVYRNDISFHKIADTTNQRMGMVAFVLTHNETGEQHVIVTNKNGYYSSMRTHSKDTNVNDAVLTEYGDDTVIPTSTLKANTGLWFGKGQNGSESKPDDNLGALPYGSYTLSELRCEANQGYELLKEITFYIEEDKSDTDLISLGTLTNDKTQVPKQEVTIHTKAKDAGNDTQVANPDQEVTIIDEVMFEGLEIGTTYQIEGILMDPATGETLRINEQEITATKEITPIKTKGTAELSFAFDGSGLAGRDIVVFEKIKKNEEIIATHEDLNDKDQTIHFPEIKTTVSDKNTSGDDTKHMITDTISYHNLVPGETYVMQGRIMEKASKSPISDQGKEVTGTTEFVPQNTSGTVDVTFLYDATQHYDRELVVFEQLYVKEVKDNNLIALHEDYEDDKQTFMVGKPVFAQKEKTTIVRSETVTTKSPQTDDPIKLILYIIVCCATCGILTLLVLKRKRYSL